MRSSLFLGALPALVIAHDGGLAGLPRVVGGSRFLGNLKSRNVFSGAVGYQPHAVEAREPSHVEERQTVTTCGPGVGSCQKGYCCSAAGYVVLLKSPLGRQLTTSRYCGTGTQYCAAPDCQFQYGPACDANTVPAGASTSSIARTHVGKIPYGGDKVNGIQDCINVGQMALTFDDG